MTQWRPTPDNFSAYLDSFNVGCYLLSSNLALFPFPFPCFGFQDIISCPVIAPSLPLYLACDSRMFLAVQYFPPVLYRACDSRYYQLFSNFPLPFPFPFAYLVIQGCYQLSRAFPLAWLVILGYYQLSSNHLPTPLLCWFKKMQTYLSNKMLKKLIATC